MQTCREARDIGVNIKLPYFQISLMPQSAPESPKYYFNLERDTIWLEDGTLMPKNLNFFCGTCQRGALFPIVSRTSNQCCHNLELERFAISYSVWTDLERGGAFDRQDVGSINVLLHLNSTASFGALEFFDQNRGLTLPIPSNMRRGLAKSWAWSERQVRETFYNFNRDRREQKRIKLEVHGQDEEQFGENGLMEMSFWMSPKVRFVEVFAAPTHT
ncbi:hypothetical protein BKA65DRAFT_478968 [Rhexocercosporidium sp. MPI-PUGE-AT-0058]|nr:hypothetical protein BKA65DRAFT_478968 [Rhexocercosporidium sp. MPI-PUGE-AT-0058]